MSNAYKLSTNQIQSIQDEDVRDLMRKLNAQLESMTFLNFSGRLIEVVSTNGATPHSLIYAHGLTFTPKDALTLYVSGSATLTWNYDSFDETNISLTLSGPCTFRALIGRFKR